MAHWWALQAAPVQEGAGEGERRRMAGMGSSRVAGRARTQDSGCGPKTWAAPCVGAGPMEQPSLSHPEYAELRRALGEMLVDSNTPPFHGQGN